MIVARVVIAAVLSSFALNMASMRSVTTNPPTTLIVANTIARKPKMYLIHQMSTVPAISSAPTIVIPEIAFEPDISGVCKVAGTLAMTSKPSRIANRNTTSENPSGPRIAAPGVGRVRGNLCKQNRSHQPSPPSRIFLVGS